MILKPPSSAKSLFSLNTPSRLKNSPTKPMVSGRPILASVAIKNMSAYFGITLARPPNSQISLV